MAKILLEIAVPRAVGKAYHRRWAPFGKTGARQNRRAARWINKNLEDGPKKQSILKRLDAMYLMCVGRPIERPTPEQHAKCLAGNR